MLKLYGGARSRASIVQWYLEELEIPYEFVLLDMEAGEHKQPEFLAINPMAKVPAIVDGDFNLWESGEILLYLAEKYGHLSESLEKRSEITQWETLKRLLRTEKRFSVYYERAIGPIARDVLI